MQEMKQMAEDNRSRQESIRDAQATQPLRRGSNYTPPKPKRRKVRRHPKKVKR